MIKDLIEEQFKIFLSKNNTSFNEYLIENRLSKPPYQTYSSMLNSGDYSDLMNYAFEWRNTKKGYYFWKDLHRKWTDIYDNYLRKGEMFYTFNIKDLYND
jgi:hypothetical protein